MAIAVQTVSTTPFTEGTNITLNKPTGTQDGDLLIAVWIATDFVDSVPSGWTQESHSSLGIGYEFYVYSKIASSEGASWTWGIGGTNENRTGMVMRITGHLSSSYFDQFDPSSVVSNDNTPTGDNTITPSVANSLVAFVVVSIQAGEAATASGYAIATDDPSWTEQADLFDDVNNHVFAVATARRPETSATGFPSCSVGSGGSADTNIVLFNILEDPNVAGTAALHSVSPSFFAPTAAANTAGTASLHSVSPTFNPASGDIENVRWTKESKNSKTWTNETR